MVFSGMAGFLIGAALPPTRWALEKFVVPKPGEGPSETSQQRGSYDLRFYGTTSKGNTDKLIPQRAACGLRAA